MQALRNQGVECGVVERWNQYAGPHGVRQDLFGFVDVVALYPGDCIVAVQCCARSGHAAHRTKILENDTAPQWIRSGGRIELWSWAKQKLKPGGRRCAGSRRWR